jgi:cation-transporting P-type ATPase E
MAAVATAESVQHTGLTEGEAARRLAARGALVEPPTSRSYASIVRANVFTIFNLILAVAGAITIVYGNAQDALFLGILVANATIGIGQEVRAKRSLDRLAALVAPTATVVRDGKPRPLPVADVVVGDLVRVQAGDQAVADGTVVHASGLRFDESILTGEARPVARRGGEEVRSGSFVTEGIGEYEVTAVGADSYAEKIAGVARKFRHARSPLERALNRLLLILVGVMVPLGAVLGYALWHRHTAVHEAVSTSVAAVVTLVPEGLILLTSVTYAVAAMRMARRGALVQRLNAIESLAAVDVVCLDKTGTLTEPRPRVLATIPGPGHTEAGVESALGDYAASAASRTGTLEAIADAYPGERQRVAAEVPFSSRRRWSALQLGGQAYVVGAPELFRLGDLAAQVEEEAGKGRRVVAIGSTEEKLGEVAGDAKPPADLELVGLVVIGEQLRAETRSTVEYFLAQGVELKVISGDRPETVAAIAREAGIPMEGGVIDGSQVDAETALTASVIGRITPDGKRIVIEALRDAGRFVAMIGDGVNDVPALKASRLAIAQGSGAQMAKSVADLVLVSGDFAAVPAMVDEGRKILRNLARVAKLFVTKSAFAAFLVVSIGLTPIAYPLLPRHLTLAASLTIGIPSFFLALAPSSGTFRVDGFLRDAFRFAFPAGTAAGLGVLSSYLFANQVLGKSLKESQTVATTVLVIVGLYLIIALEAVGQRRSAAVSALCASLAALYVVCLFLPGVEKFFSLSGFDPILMLIAIGGSAIALVGLWLTDDRFVPAMFRSTATAVA